ncbi:hypothetical protein D7V32_03340 [Acinetobacter tianfuensis]|uniref:Uncharacterized protein n=1 Tax=Acinetobacter tianfuensis TaxID=2419603 RepID=A0A3A8EEY8_9GAMM|nr:hypothetical protein D7V32_03340 [Acinetobacter tianfuensis]
MPKAFIINLFDFFTFAYSTLLAKLEVNICVSPLICLTFRHNMELFCCQHCVSIIFINDKNRIANFVVSLQAYFALCNKKDADIKEGESR